MRPLQVSASTCQRFHLAFIGRWVSWRRIQWSLVQVAGAYRASGMELRSQSAAAAGSATALHVASLPPLILLAPTRPSFVFVSVSFSHGAATASHCRRGPLFGVALQMPSPFLVLRTWSCGAWPDIDSDADALAGTGYLHFTSQRASLVVPDTP